MMARAVKSITGKLCLALLLAVLPGAPARAQNALEAKYQRAVDFFNSAKMEDACDLFTEIKAKDSAYKQIQMYSNSSCAMVKQTYQLEERIFKEAEDLFKKKQYDDAKQKYQQLLPLKLNKPKYRTQARSRIKNIDAILVDEKTFQDAEKLFQDGKYDQAKQKLNALVSKNSPRKSAAQNILGQIATREKKNAAEREDALFRSAESAFNARNYDKAKSEFRQVAALNGPKKKEANNYLARIETAKKLAQENSLFRSAQSAFNAKNYDRARREFRRVAQLNGRRKNEANSYLNRIDTARREKRLFDAAVKSFSNKKFDAAKKSFNQVVQLNGEFRAEAQGYLTRTNSALRDQSVFQAGVQKFKNKQFDAARRDFQTVVKSKGLFSGDARTYIARIDAQGQDVRQVARQKLADAQTALGSKKYSEAADLLRTGQSLDPRNRQITQLLRQTEQLLAEEPLRLGLKAFLQGEYEKAVEQLTGYLSNGGKKAALASFFRGAAHGARYFLSGEKNEDERQLALASFQEIPGQSRRFRPPEKYVSPGILNLYKEAVAQP